MTRSLLLTAAMMGLSSALYMTGAPPADECSSSVQGGYGAPPSSTATVDGGYGGVPPPSSTSTVDGGYGGVPPDTPNNKTLIPPTVATLTATMDTTATAPSCIQWATPTPSALPKLGVELPAYLAYHVFPQKPTKAVNSSNAIYISQDEDKENERAQIIVLPGMIGAVNCTIEGRAESSNNNFGSYNSAFLEVIEIDLGGKTFNETFKDGVTWENFEKHKGPVMDSPDWTNWVDTGNHVSAGLLEKCGPEVAILIRYPDMYTDVASMVLGGANDTWGQHLQPDGKNGFFVSYVPPQPVLVAA